MNNRKLLMTGLAVSSLFLGGCAVIPLNGHRYHEPVRVAPPPPHAEYVGHPPVHGHVWISGYWNWGGARYVWVPGRWQAPRHGHYWVPHRWEHDGHHWRQHGGHWAQGHPPHREARAVRQFEARDPRHAARAPDPAPLPEGRRSDRHDAVRGDRDERPPSGRPMRDAVSTEERRPSEVNASAQRFPDRSPAKEAGRNPESRPAPGFERSPSAGAHERHEASGRRERNMQPDGEKRGRERGKEHGKERSPALARE